MNKNIEFPVNIYEHFELNDRSIINALIFNTLISKSKKSEYIIGYSQITDLVPLLFSDSKTVYYRFLSFIREGKEFLIKDVINNCSFETTILQEFDLAGKCINSDLAYKYKFEESFNTYIHYKVVKEKIINRFSPVDDDHNLRVEFIENMPVKEKSVILALIKNYYPNYLNIERKLYESDFGLRYDKFLQYCSDKTITISDIRSCFHSFSLSDFWLYLFSKKIPNQCQLLTNSFIFDLNNSKNPLITYKPSLEFLTLLRDLNFIKYFSNRYNIDASNFIPLDEIYK